jgi:hypothetical protein
MARLFLASFIHCGQPVVLLCDSTNRSAGAIELDGPMHLHGDRDVIGNGSIYSVSRWTLAENLVKCILCRDRALLAWPFLWFLGIVI